MGSPSLQHQKIVEIWLTPFFDSNEYPSCEYMIIFCNVYTTRKKRIRLGMFDKKQMDLNISNLKGLTIRQASKLIREQKEQHIKMIQLLER